MNFLINLLVTAASTLILGHYILPGVDISSFGAALIFAIVLGLLNALVKPILVILTFPITILTLGIFYLIINTLIILLADYFVNGITIDGFWWALIFSVTLSILTSIINSFFKTEEK